MARNNNNQRGLTLLEVIIGTALTLLLFFGALTIYVAAAQISVNTAASSYAVTDGANAVQHTVRDVEEARWLALPGEASWVSPGGAPRSAFQTTDAGAVISTGVQLVFPSTAAAAVQDRGGGSLSVAPTLYDRTQDSASSLWIYRANSDGTPNAAAGTVLWMTGNEKGQTVNQALISSLSSSTANAVNFSRPLSAAPALQMLPYQLQISLVSTYYSPLRQAQTSEINSTAQEEAVVGKCVLMRDHEMNLDHEPNPTSSYGTANAPNLRSD